MRSIQTFFKTTVVLLTAVVFSCSSPYEEVQKINDFTRLPVGIGENIRVVYTDSGYTKAILTAPINKDFTNQKYPYSEFPEGLKVVFFDKNQNATNVVADYGILYNRTKIIDLQGHVVIQTHDSARLETSQLYWDPNLEWLFTEKNFTFTNKDYDIQARRLDASRSFDIFQTGELSGTVAVEETE